MFHLVVVKEFAGHARGERIEDQAAIEAILNGENQGKVAKVEAPANAAAPEA